MAAQKAKASGGKKKKGGKGKAPGGNNTQSPQPPPAQPLQGIDSDTPESLRHLHESVTTFMSVLEKKLKRIREYTVQAASMAHVALVVITSCDDRVSEHVESLIPIFEELSDPDHSMWTGSGPDVISTLSNKFTKWASAQGLLYQYTRALVEGKPPAEEAAQIKEQASRDHIRISTELFRLSGFSNAPERHLNSKTDDTSSPSLDSMIEALSASGVEVSAQEASSQTTSESTQPQQQPKDPKHVAQAFLMFKPYMSQMIEARRKAEQETQSLKNKCEKLTERIQKLETRAEPQLLSQEAEFEVDTRLSLDKDTREFMKDRFKGFLAQYDTREKIFQKILQARSSETAVQIMKVKKYRELSRAGWKLASDALESLSGVEDKIRILENSVYDYRSVSAATIESLVKEHESSKRDFKHIQTEYDQSKKKQELMNVMMNDVILYNTELKQIIEDLKFHVADWRQWGVHVGKKHEGIFRLGEMDILAEILERAEQLVPVGQPAQPPGDNDIERLLKNRVLENGEGGEGSKDDQGGNDTPSQQVRAFIEASKASAAAVSGSATAVSSTAASAATKSSDATSTTVAPPSKKPTVPAPVAPEALAAAPAAASRSANKSISAQPTASATQNGASSSNGHAEAEVYDYDGDKEDGLEDEDDEFFNSLRNAGLDGGVKRLPETSLPPTHAEQGILSVYSPVASEHGSEDSREAEHDEVDGEDDDDFGYKRYVTHEGDVSSEEDEYFLRAKFGICYNDRYPRKGKVASPAVNSYMSAYGGTPDKTNNLCAHDMKIDYGKVRFSDRKGHLFSEVLLHDYVQSDDDTSMQNWTDEVEWEEDDDETEADETSESVKTEDAPAAAEPESIEPGTPGAIRAAAELERQLFDEGDNFNAVQIPQAFTDEEWQTLRSASLYKIVPLLLSYMLVQQKPSQLDSIFPSFVSSSFNWSGALATIKYLAHYYNGHFNEEWDPIRRTIASTASLQELIDEDSSCPLVVDIVPYLLFAGKALTEVLIFPSSLSGQPKDEALQAAAYEHQGSLSAEDLYRLVLEHRPPLWNTEIYTTLLDALVRSFVALYMRVSRLPTEIDKVADFQCTDTDGRSGTRPQSSSASSIMTRAQEELAKFTVPRINRYEETMLRKASSTLRRCITFNVYPVSEVGEERSVQEKVVSFLQGEGKDAKYNEVLASNYPMLLRALSNNKLDTERIAQLQDAYQEMDGRRDNADGDRQ